MKPYHKDADFSYSIGVFPTLELLDTHPETVTHVYLSSRAASNSGVDRITAFCAAHHLPITISDTSLARLSGAQNCFAAAAFTKYPASLSPSANHLVLVTPSDRGNLGTIVRTQLAFSLPQLAIISPAVDIFDPKVIRASMGAVFRLNFAYFSSFSDYQQQFSGHHLYPFLTSGSLPLPQVRLTPPYSLIFGPEGAGLPASFATLGQPVAIPQSHQVDSLNLSVAVAIGLYATHTAA